jgi:cardiolipin synthase A/B
MNVRLAIPVYFASLTIHVEKGRRWNAVEHMLLYAVCQAPTSASDLAVDSKMELRLVIEVMIRLMRAGWVELESGPDGMKFKATPAGTANVDHDDLPVITSPKKRRASFVIERVTGTIFRSWDLTLYNRHDYQKLKETNEIVELPTVDVDSIVRQDQIILTLLDEDDECKHIEAVPGRFGEKFAIVSVIGETIEGLPSRASKQLKNKILSATTHKVPLIVDATPEFSKDDSVSDQILRDPLLRIKFDAKDFIVGAKEHEELLMFHLRRARSRVVIHSTFIDVERFRALVPLLHDAARRGVRIDILWGKNDQGDELSQMQQVVVKCRAMLVGDDIRERITIHNTSTNSHAKILIVDNEKGKMIAVLGSCNWLYTGFHSTEVSVRLDHPLIVSQIIGHLGRMAAGPGMDWTSLATDLALQATRLRSVVPSTSGISVDARLVFGSEHSHFVRMARDEAKSRIVITSHRFGHNAETLVLRPTTAAVKANDVDVKLFYGQLDGDADGAVAAAIAEKARAIGIRHEQIRDPNLHAKVLAWDNDSVVVTSQNWLSADPSDNDTYSEVGIYLTGSNLAQEMVQLLLKTMPQH